MAEKQGGLSLRIGLTLSQLQSDFLAAEQTVKQGIASLNRQQNLVKIRMDTDIAGLDAVIDKTKILEIQERGLTQLLEMQRDKLTLATAAYRDYAASKGANDVGAKKLETAMERERLAVVRLESELKKLSEQKISIDTTQLQSNIAKLNAQIQHVKIKAEIDTSQLSGAASAFDAQRIHIAAVTRELELQRQKLIQLRATMFESAQRNGADNIQTLNIKSNVLTQIQEIQRLEQKLKDLQSTNINLQIRSDSIRQAEQAISDSISRINARIENIRVRAEIDTSKLSVAASEFDKAKVHVAAFTKELELQTQKLTELKKAYATSVSTTGLNSVKSVNLNTDIQRQIQLINQLEAKIKELNSIPPPKTNNLLSGYLNIKGDIAGKLNNITSAINGITTASQSADGAISKSLEIIGAMPTPIGKGVAALASIPLVIKGVESSLLSLSENVVATGDAFYVMSRGMQLSIADAGKLSTIAKVTGIEISDINNTMRRFSMQLTKGDENSLLSQTLKLYGAELTDEMGRLKNELELAKELSKAFRAAQAEGNGAAFRDIVGGKFWSGDFITFLEDFADNEEAAGKIVKNGLFNPTFAHQVQGEINTLNTQLAQTKSVFDSALLPVVHEIVPRATERFGELTKVIQANKENVKFLGDALALPVRLLNEMTDGVISLSKAIDEAKDKETTLGKLFAQIGEYRDDLGALMNVAPMTALTAIVSPNPGATTLAIMNHRKEIEEFKKAQAEAERESEAQKAKEEANQGRSILEQQKLETALSSSEERRTKMVQEAEDIIYGIRHSSYEKQLREHERWQSEELAKIQELQELAKNILGKEGLFDDEEAAFYELDEAKLLQIEEEKEQRLAEIRQRITADEQTESQKRMTAIDAEKEKWIQAGMERAEAEQLAQKQKADYIKGVEQELATALNELHQTELENRLSQIEREKQAWIDKGASQEQAERLAQEKITQAYQQQADKLNGIRESVASLYRSDLENRLDAIDKEQKAWVEAGMTEAEAVELASAKKQKVYEEEAQKSEELAEKKAKAEEDYQKKVQAAQEEANRKNKAARDEALNILKSEADEFAAYLAGGDEALKKFEYNKLTKSGVDPELMKKMTPENWAGYKAAKEYALDNVMPNWEAPYSAKPVAHSLDELKPAAENATDALNYLADSALQAANNGGETGYYDESSGEDMSENGKSVGAFEQPDSSIVIKDIDPDVKYKEPMTNSVYHGQNDNEPAQATSQDYEPATEIDTSAFSEAISTASEGLNELQTAVAGTTENLSAMDFSQFEGTANAFSALEPETESLAQQFSSIAIQIEEVTVQLSNLSEILSNLSHQSDNFQPTETRQPVEVTTNVQIEEAHAWDYNHIQELADRVAEIIQPAITSAIGGDSNSY